jgi:hypothetical protein
MLNLLRNSSFLLRNELNLLGSQAAALFHTTPLNSRKNSNAGHSTAPTHFLRQNKKIFEPQLPSEEPRPAVSCTIHSIVVC